MYMYNSRKAFKFGPCKVVRVPNEIPCYISNLKICASFFLSRVSIMWLWRVWFGFETVHIGCSTPVTCRGLRCSNSVYGNNTIANIILLLTLRCVYSHFHWLYFFTVNYHLEISRFVTERRSDLHSRGDDSPCGISTPSVTNYRGRKMKMEKYSSCQDNSIVM